MVESNPASQNSSHHQNLGWFFGWDGVSARETAKNIRTELLNYALLFLVALELQQLFPANGIVFK